MKKSISLALCLALACFALTGCSGEAEPFVQEEYTADPSQVQEIVIDVEDRQIDVSLAEDGQIHILYSANSEESYDIAVSDENVLTMTIVYNKDWTDYIGLKPSAEDRRISVQVPDALLDALSLSTTNEDISLSDLTVTGSISLSSNGGDISFEPLAVGDALYLTVKNGDIEGTVAGSYEDFAIQTEIKKGESNLPEEKEGGEKTLQVSGNNGDVHIVFASEALSA